MHEGGGVNGWRGNVASMLVALLTTPPGCGIHRNQGSADLPASCPAPPASRCRITLIETDHDGDGRVDARTAFRYARDAMFYEFDHDADGQVESTTRVSLPSAGRYRVDEDADGDWDRVTTWRPAGWGCRQAVDVDLATGVETPDDWRECRGLGVRRTFARYQTLDGEETVTWVTHRRTRSGPATEKDVDMDGEPDHIVRSVSSACSTVIEEVDDGADGTIDAYHRHEFVNGLAISSDFGESRTTFEYDARGNLVRRTHEEHGQSWATWDCSSADGLRIFF